MFHSLSSSSLAKKRTMMISQRHLTAACITVAFLVAMVMYLMTTLTDGMEAVLLSKNIFTKNDILSDLEQPLPKLQPSNATITPVILKSKATPDPVQNLVSLKTHKTGSSTVTSVLQRYGYLSGLSFLMPKCGHVFDTYHHFDISKVKGISSKSARKRKTLFNFLTNHARYSRRDMDRVFRGAKYVTIVRNPVSQFESMFYYFEMFKYLPKGNTTLAAFFEDPERNFEFMRSRTKQLTEKRMHNQQLFDLGVDLNDMSNALTIDATIDRLQDEFDLVMITEYFDESMLLLSKLMNWKLEDVRYIPRGARQSAYRQPLADDLRAQIRSWNSADVKLYEHFNRTFWDKVKEYGPAFDEDLHRFRRLQDDLSDTCRDVGRDDRTDRRVVKARLKKEAPEWCSYFFTDDKQFTSLIRKRMVTKGLPLYDSCDQLKRKAKTNL